MRLDHRGGNENTGRPIPLLAQKHKSGRKEEKDEYRILPMIKRDCDGEESESEQEDVKPDGVECICQESS